MHVLYVSLCNDINMLYVMLSVFICIMYCYLSELKLTLQFSLRTVIEYFTLVIII